MKILYTMTLTTLLVLPGVLAAKDKDTYKLIDRGLDLDTRYYSVGCPDGTMGSVSVQFDNAADMLKEVSDEVRLARIGSPKTKPPKIIEVCAYPTEGDEKCKSSWNVQAAAKASCK